MSKLQIIQGRQRSDIESAVSRLTTEGPRGVNRYGRPMFKTRFALLRHCIKVTDVSRPLPASYFADGKMFQPTAYQMETAFEMGAIMFLALGVNKTPLPGEVLRNINYYKTFLK